MHVTVYRTNWANLPGILALHPLYPLWLCRWMGTTIGYGWWGSCHTIALLQGLMTTTLHLAVQSLNVHLEDATGVAWLVVTWLGSLRELHTESHHCLCCNPVKKMPIPRYHLLTGYSNYPHLTLKLCWIKASGICAPFCNVARKQVQRQWTSINTRD